MRTLTIVVSLLFGLLAAPQVGAEDTSQKAVLVLDASGSMWGQVDGVAKIQIAKEVIDGLLTDWDPSVELGLMAYGHRQTGACDDIETLISVGPVDKDAVMATLGPLNPKGKTPITASVRAAAEALNYTEDKASIILVSDGLETCNADPCSLATELETNGVDFVAHVIGFDMRPEETAQLKCIADNTGGKFLNAGTASELTSALKATVENVVAAEKEFLFAETFDDDAERGSALNFETFDQFSIQKGSVDIIGSGSYGINCAGNRGGCVDLDGTTQGTDPTALFVTRDIRFEGGVEYILSFAISGNQRGFPEDRLDIFIGDEMKGSFGPFASADPFQTYSVIFMTTEDSTMSIGFQIPGPADLAGPILDDVYVKRAGDN